MGKMGEGGSSYTWSYSFELLKGVNYSFWIFYFFFFCCWQQELVHAVTFYFPVSGLVQLKESLSVFFSRIRKRFLLKKCDENVLPTQIFN